MKKLKSISIIFILLILILLNSCTTEDIEKDNINIINILPKKNSILSLNLTKNKVLLDKVKNKIHDTDYILLLKDSLGIINLKKQKTVLNSYFLNRIDYIYGSFDVNDPRNTASLIVKINFSYLLMDATRQIANLKKVDQVVLSLKNYKKKIYNHIYKIADFILIYTDGYMIISHKADYKEVLKRYYLYTLRLLKNNVDKDILQKIKQNWAYGKIDHFDPNVLSTIKLKITDINLESELKNNVDNNISFNINLSLDKKLIRPFKVLLKIILKNVLSHYLYLKFDDIKNMKITNQDGKIFVNNIIIKAENIIALVYRLI